jgi:hypothetical protein
VLDRVILQRIVINDTVKEKVGVVEPQFTYIFFQPQRKTSARHHTGQRSEAAKATVNSRKRSRRIIESTSPRVAGIAKAALNQFVGNTFLDKSERTIKVNETPLDPEDMVNGVVRPVINEIITK